jgi:hypothetical protein
MSYFAKEDIRGLHAQLAERSLEHGATARILYETCSRPSEVLGNAKYKVRGLTWGDVDLAGEQAVLKLQVLKRGAAEKPSLVKRMWNWLRTKVGLPPPPPTRKWAQKEGKVFPETTKMLRALRARAVAKGRAKKHDRVFTMTPQGHWKAM